MRKGAKQHKHSQKAFSLLELLIVIVIVALVYGLGFSAIEFTQAKPKALSPLNLKENIQKSKLFSGQTTLMCLDKCRTCYMRDGISSAFSPYENSIDLSDITAYTLDKDEILTPIEYGRYDDKKVCLMIDFYTNGSSTQVILEDEESAYFLPAFFGKAQAFASIEEAKEYWLKEADSVSNNEDFY